FDPAPRSSLISPPEDPNFLRSWTRYEASQGQPVVCLGNRGDNMRHLGTPLHRNGLLIALLLTVISAGQALAGSAGFVYALREVSGGANQIYGFRLDASSGALTPLPGFPVASGGNGSDVTVSEQLAYDATNSRLYVVNDG